MQSDGAANSEDERRPRTEGPSASRAWGHVGASLRPWLMLLLVCALFSLHPEFRGAFWRREYLVDVVGQSARNIVLAVGLTFVILTGGIDLSVGSVLALSGVGIAMALTGTPRLPVWMAALAALPPAVLASALMVRAVRTESRSLRWLAGGCACILVDGAVAALLWRGTAGGVKVEAAVAIGLCVGLGCGLVNGAIVSVWRVPSFVATLGMMSAARGLTLYATGSQSVSVPFERFRALGEGAPLLVVTLVVVAAGALLLGRFRAGRYVLAIGGNEQAALLSGVPVAAHKTLAYALSGICAAIGGLLITAKFGTANTGAGTGAELEAIAAVVIGGASLSGGKGTIVGALVGALTITVITNGLVLVGIEPNLQQVILGGVIVATVFVDQLRRRGG
ncbi:MAG TPA: ABC transporter permease [Chthonomonadaceae bacterium]|nr:ABC transporter permease [Chthonomonadaceae bacterium]